MKKLLFVMSFWMLPALAQADVICRGTDAEEHALEVIFSEITTSTPSVKLHYLENSSFPMGKCRHITKSETTCRISIGVHSRYAITLWSLDHSGFVAELEHTLFSESENIALSCQSQP